MPDEIPIARLCNDARRDWAVSDESSETGFWETLPKSRAAFTNAFRSLGRITTHARMWASRSCSVSQYGRLLHWPQNVDCVLPPLKPESEQYESLGWVLLQALSLRLSFEPRDRNGISLE